MFSYAKTVRRDEVARFRKEFEANYRERGEPAHMWLAQARHPDANYTYLIWISDKRPARAVALGFETGWTPKHATVLAGNPETFEKCVTHKAHAA